MDWSQRAALLWFTQSQLQSVISNGIVPDWFHGIISRKAAEELLMTKPPGFFLIRVSESRVGFTLSYRAVERCRHFMIDALEDGHYVIAGESRRHRFLQDLVDFHRRAPIIPFNEVLTVACGQNSGDKADYAELLFPQRHWNHNTSLQPNSLLLPGASHPVSQEEIPPALPCRPDDLRNSVVLSPNSQSNQLYPTVEAEPHVTYSLLATPVPMVRKRCTADNPSSTQPPEVPARSCVPPPRQSQACIRTASSPSPLGANTQPGKNQRAKPTVVANLKIVKMKLQKKTSAEATEISGNTENEYQEIAEEKPPNRPHFSWTVVTEGGLPQEYRLPPPFAPGY